MTKSELLPVSERPKGYTIETGQNKTSATFVWDKEQGIWQMTSCQRQSDDLAGSPGSVDPMERVIWHRNNGASEQPAQREEVNIIPQLVNRVREGQGRTGVWIYPDTDLSTLVNLEPGRRPIVDEFYQRMRNEGATLLITVGGITSQPAPKK